MSLLGNLTVGILGNMNGLNSTFKGAQNQVQKFGKSVQNVGRGFTEFGSSLTQVVTGPIVALGASSIKAAISFESAFAGVRKTVDASEKEFGVFRQGIRDMAKEIPVAATEIAGVAEAAGQLGIKKEAILGFTRTMVDLGVATNMTSEQAANDLARLANITQMPQDQFDRLGSAIVALGNNFATTESEITAMSLRLAGQGKQIGLTEHQILALATAMSSVGIEAEAGGTAMSTIMKKIQSAVGTGGRTLEGFAQAAGMSTTQFKKAFEKDASKAILAFVQGLGKSSKEGKNLTDILAKLGIKGIRESDTLLRLSGASNVLADSLEISAKGWKENVALTNEAEQRYKTTESQLKIFWNRIKDIGITIGDALIPALVSALNALDPFIKKIEQAAEWFKNLNPSTQATIVVISAIAAAIGPVLVAMGMLITNVGTIISTFGKLGGVILKLGRTILTATGPIGIVVAAIVTAAIVIYKNWEPIKAFFIKLWGDIKNITLSVWNSLKAVWKSTVEWFRNIWSSITGFFSKLWSGITTIATNVWTNVVSVWTNVVSTIKTIFAPIVAFFKSIWESVSNTITSVWSTITKTLTTVWTNIKTIASAAWTLIKNVILGPILLLIDLATGNFQGFKSHLSQIWNNIKTAATTIWNIIKSSVVAIIQGFVNVGKSIFNGFKSVLQTIWNAIKNIAVNVWNSLKTAVINIINALKTGAIKVWNALKTGVINVVNAIKNGAVNTWEGLKTTVINLANNIKNGAIEAWETLKTNTSKAFKKVVKFIKDPLGEIDLYQIGKDIINGLINGIGDMADAVWEKAKSIASSIGDAIKKTLDIHSPSRVTHKLGEHTGQGFANGIAAKKKAAEKAARSAATAATKAYNEAMSKAKYKFQMGKINSSQYISELRKIREEYAKTPAQVRKVNLEIKKIQDKHAKELKAIEEKKFKDALKTIKDKAAAGKLATDQELKQLQALAKKYKKNSEERLIIDKEIAKVKTKLQKEEDKKFNDALKKIKDKAAANKISTAEEIKQLENLAKKYKKNSDERLKVEKEIAKAKKQLAKEEEARLEKQFNKEKDTIQSKKDLNQLSLTDELKLYESYLKKYKKGSEERKYWEQQIYDVKKRINDQLISINEEYTNKIQEANQKLIEGEKALNEEYQKALDDRTKSLYNFAGLFDEINRNSEVSGQQLLDNLKGQVEVFAEWQANMASLAKRGISEGLLQELQEMGPKSAAEIAALNSLTDEQLAEYVALWQTKNNQAKEQATQELEGMKADTAKKIDELRAQTQAQLDLYKTEWIAKITEIKTGTKNQFNAMTASMNSIGKNTIKGLMNGMSAMEGPLMEQAKAIADAISKTIKKALDIHSPSRLLRGMGIFAGEGLRLGLSDMISDISSTAKQLAIAAIPSIPDFNAPNVKGIFDSMKIKDFNLLSLVGRDSSKGRGDINQYLTINSPKPLSPSETARLNKQTLIQLGMEWRGI